MLQTLKSSDTVPVNGVLTFVLSGERTVCGAVSKLDFLEGLIFLDLMHH